MQQQFCPLTQRTPSGSGINGRGVVVNARKDTSNVGINEGGRFVVSEAEDSRGCVFADAGERAQGSFI